jgi:hypothetical protein
MIIVVLIIFLVIVLAGLFYSGFLMMVYPIYDYLFHTRWGLLAIISFILSYFFGYASKRTHEDVVLKDELMNSVKLFISDISGSFNKNIKSTNRLLTNNNKIMDKKNSESLMNLGKNENVIDMSKMNLDGVLKNLAKSINKPTPFILKGWSNRSLRLDVEKVNILTEYIKSIKDLGNEFLELQADAILSIEKIEHFIKTKRKKNDIELDLLTDQAENLRHIYKSEREKRDIENEILRADLRKKNVINDILEDSKDKLDVSNPEVIDLLKTLVNPDSKTESSINSIDKDYARMEILLKEKEVNAKEIENLKSDIERKQMNDKYKANKQ